MNHEQEHVLENRRHWDDMADQWVKAGKDSWASEHPYWGIWSLPESKLQLLPSSLKDKKAIELGCGTAYVSSWLAKRGAEVVGIDNSERQLDTASRLMREHEISLTLLHGNAERVPYPDEYFDFAISEYGAATWCNPKLWIPEAYRLLKPGGNLVFLGTHPFAICSSPLDGSATTEKLHRPYFGLHKIDWRYVENEPGGIEFNLTHSEWLSLFQEVGFEVVKYQELQAPLDSEVEKFYVTASWAQKWPSEQVWYLKKR